MPTSKGSILITGANGGLGSALVTNVLETPDLASNYTGLYTVRKVNGQAASRLRSVLVKAPASHAHETLELDLSSLESVKRVAADINRRTANGEMAPIRALILNAGFQENTTLTMTDDGFETTWQINFLSNLVLSLLLLQSMDKDSGRVLIVSSWAHDIDDERNALGGNDVYKDPRWPTLFPGPEALARGRWSTPEEDASTRSGFRRYGASKLCAVMLMHELGYRLAKDPKLSNVVVLGLDPGGMATDIVRRGSWTTRLVTMKLVIPLLAAVMVRWSPNGVARPTWKSAADIMEACFTRPAPKDGVLYLNGSEPHQTAKDAHDSEKRRALWTYGVKAAGIEAGDTALADWR
ncbi:hypothetical protein XA68_12585 [Ophiocordyceps unilateralis]|uniref:Ketoreductase (KR) domain-containing protein n=1 Tax=Ophiocordyceps unilateralis TaxID=268505 RepID=A0A2A9PEG5_OPHUN|nr:hypothetical protein XA68_12585 [Ophiocordyceps unilateralis]